MTDGRDLTVCIAYLLRFSGFAEGVFWRSFMNWGVEDGFPAWYNQRCERTKSSRIELVIDPTAEIPLESGLYRSTENRVHTAFQAQFVLCKLW
jgi:hypothetical protein